uniref:Uncharacterized protein n=1 Tax=Arundo donax TaxID=35708 RepID=A0A0A8YAI1_ARUDO
MMLKQKKWHKFGGMKILRNSSAP